MSIREVVDSTALIDNHAHPVEPQDAETIRESFATFFTEGELSPRHARHTMNYRAALALLRDRFDGGAEADLLAERAAVDLESYSRDLIARTDTEVILADDGYPTTSPAEFRAYTDATVKPLVRIEPVIERLIAETDDFATFETRLEERLATALEEDAMGLKSIVAYRTGLDIGAPDREAAARTYADLGDDWDGRIAHAPLLEYLVHRACVIAGEAGAPIQFHTGFGDSDAHPRYVDPSYLYDLIRAHPETDIVLLHAGYPYVGAASYVTSTFENVHLDISLALPFIQHGCQDLLRRTLEVTPATKLLYGSDAFCVPELYVLAATRIRTDLTRVLEDLVADGFIDEAYATTVARNVLRENAIALYDL